MRKIHTYCFDKCAMLPYHLGLELRGGAETQGGYYLLYPPWIRHCVHSFILFILFLLFSFSPHLIFFPSSPLPPSPFPENSMVVGKQVKDCWEKKRGVGENEKGRKWFSPFLFFPQILSRLCLSDLSFESPNDLQMTSSDQYWPQNKKLFRQISLWVIRSNTRKVAGDPLDFGDPYEPSTTYVRSLKISKGPNWKFRRLFFGRKAAFNYKYLLKILI